MVTKNVFILSALCVMAIAVLSACGPASSAAPILTTAVPAAATLAPASTATLAPINAATQAPVSQNTGGTGDSNAQWPSQMPADVPVFTYGTIYGSSNNVVGKIQASFVNVSADAFTKYQSDLKNAGWTIGLATQSADGFNIYATNTNGSVGADVINMSGLKFVVVTFQPNQ